MLTALVLLLLLVVLRLITVLGWVLFDVIMLLLRCSVPTAGCANILAGKDFHSSIRLRSIRLSAIGWTLYLVNVVPVSPVRLRRAVSRLSRRGFRASAFLLGGVECGLVSCRLDVCAGFLRALSV